MFKNRYRVVSDSYLGYQVDCKRWWFPLWVQCGFTNTHSSLEKAKEYIEYHKAGAVYYE